MESLGYIFMYFLRGSLPWQNLKAATKHQKYERISEKKMSTPIEELCRNFPSEFVTYLTICRSLKFDDKPDYSQLRHLFRNLFYRQSYTYDYVFDWNIYKSQKSIDSLMLSKNVGQPTPPADEAVPNEIDPYTPDVVMVTEKPEDLAGANDKRGTSRRSLSRIPVVTNRMKSTTATRNRGNRGGNQTATGNAVDRIEGPLPSARNSRNAQAAEDNKNCGGPIRTQRLGAGGANDVPGTHSGRPHRQAQSRNFPKTTMVTRSEARKAREAAERLNQQQTRAFFAGDVARY